MEKVEGPSTQLSFLGITLDNVRMEARLPIDKLMRIKQITTLWLSNIVSCCTTTTCHKSLSTFVSRMYVPISMLPK